MAIERTLLLIKPDAVQRNLIGVILQRLERKGMAVIGMRMMQANEQQTGEHYAEHLERPYYPKLLRFFLESPLVAVALEGHDAIAIVRMLIGATDGRKAAPGTIRGDFGCSNSANLVHASDSSASADRELGIWFPNGHGLLNWTQTRSPWLDRPDL